MNEAGRDVVESGSGDPDIRRHLLDVASALTDAGSQGLRGELLRALEVYARAGRFPRWEHRIAGRSRARAARRFHASGRRAPRFRDPHGTWCAVGHLMSLTDPELAQALADRFEDRWLDEMHDPRIGAWADRHGFTLDELAWIQPEYCWQPSMCDEIEMVVAAPVDEQSCEGPDARPRPVQWNAFCQDGCDGPFRVWVDVVNAGTEAATGVTVELWGGQPAQTLDAELVDVPAGASLVVELQTLSVMDVGRNGGITVDDPEGCNGAPWTMTVWDTGNGGAGWVLPDTCGGSCDTGADTGPQTDHDHPRPCGCASVGPGGLGWLVVGSVAALRRRRPTSTTATQA